MLLRERESQYADVDFRIFWNKPAFLRDWLTLLSTPKQGTKCLCQSLSCWVFAKEAQSVYLSFSSHLPRNLKESSLPVLLYDLHAWLFKREGDLQNNDYFKAFATKICDVAPSALQVLLCLVSLFKLEGRVSTRLLLWHRFLKLYCVCPFWSTFIPI